MKYGAWMVGLSLWLGVFRLSGAEVADRYAHMIQDRIELDLYSGELLLNEAAMSPEQFLQCLEAGHSIELTGVPHSEQNFAVPSSHLVGVLEKMDQAGIDPERVRIELNMPALLKRHDYQKIEIAPKGKLILNGAEVSVEELAEKDLPRTLFTIDLNTESKQVDYRYFLSILRALGDEAMLGGLNFTELRQAEVEALIYQTKGDGSEEVISAPKLTAKLGRSATIRIVENGTGRLSYALGTDEFHQEDLANLGIRFAVKPQFLDDGLRVSGVAIITKQTDRVGVFVDDGVPIASYACTKLVVPFSVDFPEGTDTIDFPVAKVGDEETHCRLTARIVDDRGMTKAQRELIRAASQSRAATQ